MTRAYHILNLPKRRVCTTKMQMAADLKEQGKTYPEIAAVLGIAVGTAKNYANNATRGDGRNHGGDGPRCQCGLLLPCTCTEPMRAENFARSGEAAY